MASIDMPRGVIAVPGIIHPQGDGFTFERALSPEELRYYALYWDKVVIPGTNLVYVEIPEEQVLIQTGVISRPRVAFTGSFSGRDVARSFAFAQAKVAKELANSEPTTDWVVHQFGPSIELPADATKELRTLRFELADLLPVPHSAVPIFDILEFKERRRDELRNLHNCLDEAYLEALRSPNRELSNKIAIANLRAAIAAVDTLSMERWNRTKKYDLTAELNLDGSRLFTAAAAGAVFDFFSNPMTIPVGTIAGAVASAFKLSAKVSNTFEPSQGQLKLSYLSHARDAGIVALRQ